MSKKIIGHKQQQNHSPSNIETGWRQKFYYKLEFDGKLDLFIEIFQKNGNNWEMNKDLFESIIDKNGIDREKLIGYNYVYNDVLEIMGDKIRIKPHIVNELLRRNYQFSVKNTLKQVRINLCKLLNQGN